MPRSLHKFIYEHFRAAPQGAGVPRSAHGEGYAVRVGGRNGRNVIFIAANEMHGVYYRVVDFISSYLPTVTPTLFPNPNVKGASDALCAERLPSWKHYTVKYIKNAVFAARLTRRISEKTDTDADFRLLVEYGAFEKAIMPPVAIAAEMFRQPCGETVDIVERVIQSPFVKFPQTAL